ncbi:hypothetical protein GTQ99_00640 [Kineococcus sp. T13]|nr:hypothetical protein [Kineococcus vitellinus]NAZ73939.1 hypothetical protein [Kineococcus vitellinus]
MAIILHCTKAAAQKRLRRAGLEPAKQVGRYNLWTLAQINQLRQAHKEQQ